MEIILAYVILGLFFVFLFVPSCGWMTTIEYLSYREYLIKGLKIMPWVIFIFLSIISLGWSVDIISGSMQ